MVFMLYREGGHVLASEVKGLSGLHPAGDVCFVFVKVTHLHFPAIPSFQGF